MNNLFKELLLEHYKTPLHGGEIQAPSISHKEENHTCGDICEIDLKVENDKAIEIKHRGVGCVLSRAAIDIIIEEIIGDDLSSIKEMNKENVYELLSEKISARRAKCALLGFLTIQNAINSLNKHKKITFVDIIHIK